MKSQPLLFLLLFGVLFLASCSNDRGARPEVRGEGTGREWAPEKDGKFVLYSVENTSSIEIQLVCHSKKTGTYKLTVEPNNSRFMVVKEDDYVTELRGREAESKLGVYDMKEERILGVRRVYFKAVSKESDDARKAKQAAGK